MLVLKTSRFLYELLSLTTSITLNCPQPSAKYHFAGSLAKHWQLANDPARESSPTARPIHEASYQLPVVPVEQAAGAPLVWAWGMLARITKSFEPAQPSCFVAGGAGQYGRLPGPHAN